MSALGPLFVTSESCRRLQRGLCQRREPDSFEKSKRVVHPVMRLRGVAGVSDCTGRVS